MPKHLHSKPAPLIPSCYVSVLLLQNGHAHFTERAQPQVRQLGPFAVVCRQKLPLTYDDARKEIVSALTASPKEV